MLYRHFGIFSIERRKAISPTTRSCSLVFLPEKIMSRILSLLLVSLIVLAFLCGCSERDETTTNSGSTLKADTALKSAEQNLKSAGVPISFDDPSQLAKPEELMPDLKILGTVEKQKNLQSAITQLNIVLSELDQEAKLAPPTIGSVSDLAMVHFYLGLAYVLDAISRLLISDDPNTTFIIEYDPKISTDAWFKFDISKEVKAKLDATKNPLEYPIAFTAQERQALIDAVDLVNDAAVRPTDKNIQPQSSSVNGPPYVNSALWHFEKALDFFAQYDPDLQEGLEEFNIQIDKFESMLQQDSEKWGFTYTSSPGR